MNLLQTAQLKYPHLTLRVSPMDKNIIQKKCGCSWKAMCIRHGKINAECKECGGSAFCKSHGKRMCKECRPYLYCQHGRLKYRCKEEHKRREIEHVNSVKDK